ncbi:MAG: hypothetical protein LBV76_04095 [Deltaproteobacteria bacterium]|jgi:homocitrate synthase NifV|nr:hypothetical protein [Deltaproteobacteria bacterium]
MRIIDVTLSELRSGGIFVDQSAAARWQELMLELGIDAVEVAPASPGESENLPRLVGFGDALLHSGYRALFADLRRREPEPELSFTNEYGCATALAVEWLMQGGRAVVCSFTGLGNLAPLEEVVMTMYVQQAHFCGRISALAGLRAMWLETFHQPVGRHKAVIGEQIFAVESGIHVDGLMKDASLYEPFPPECVGLRRKIVLGSHSGQGSLRLQCKLLGLDCAEDFLPLLLQSVHTSSRERERSLTDEEFVLLHKRLFAESGHAYRQAG